LVSTAIGEIELEDRTLVVRRIHVTYQLQLEDEQQEAAERAHKHHQHFCPVARTIEGCVKISTSLETVPVGA
jgi:organic hydroperoxide reductase OsmC/OhrA